MTYYNEDMHHICTYFAPDDADTYGNVTYAEPVELACRWQDEQNTIVTPEGKEITTIAVVYIEALVAVQGRLALGTFGTDEEALAASRIIKSVIVSNSLDADEQLVKALL